MPLQLSPGANIWASYNSAVHQQRISHEEDGSPKFRGSPTGTSPGPSLVALALISSLTQFFKCALPVFEGLLDEPHDSIVQDLLFTLAYWQALAKLRLHTTFSIAALKNVTCQLGRQLRNFTKKTCSAFTTKELPREEAARGRRNAKKAAAAREAGLPPPKAASGGSKIKIFNMLTYKGHSLGDYVRTILFFGTTDSYSTQPVR
jgi:hypothetical protein